MASPIKPRALAPGDRLALAAPSGAVADPSKVELAVAFLERSGFEVEVGDCCRARHGYLAGTDAERAAELQGFFADPRVAGIVCMQGGYGTPRLVASLDYEMISRNAKVLVGYSDITGLHLALGRRAGLVTFHGPMGGDQALASGEEYTAASWLRALTLAEPLGELAPPPLSPGLRVLAPGSARGPLAGGNLCLVAAAMGTPFELDARGRVLFLEDVHEYPYRVDRMLTQLALAGKFRDCAGVVLGSWKLCEPEEGKASLSLDEVFLEAIAAALGPGKPLVAGLAAGHCSPSMTLPLGVECSLEASASGARLSMLEPALLPARGPI